MPRIIVSLVAGLLVLGVMPMATADQKERIHREMHSDCQFDFITSRVWSPWEEHLTARCLVLKWPVSGGLPKLDSVISCESGWYRYASNGGSYLGLGQHAASSWPGRVRAYEPPGWRLRPAWWNSRSNLTVTVRMAHSVGWGPWTCA
jgi:hypothetical protein